MAIEDIIPLNLLLEKSAESESQQGSYPQKKKKKVDKEALASSFMRIPKMNVTRLNISKELFITDLFLVGYSQLLGFPFLFLG